MTVRLQGGDYCRPAGVSSLWKAACHGSVTVSIRRRDRGIAHPLRRVGLRPQGAGLERDMSLPTCDDRLRPTAGRQG